MAPSTGSNFNLARVPFVDSKGMLTRDALLFLQQVYAKTDQSLTLAGDLSNSVSVQGSSAQLAQQVENLDANGIVLPNGINRWSTSGSSGQQAGQNLLFNPIGAFSLNGWIAAGSWSAQTGTAQDTFPGRFYCDGAQTATLSQQIYPATTGPYTYSAWLEIDQAVAGMHIGVDVYDATTSTVVKSQYETTAGNFQLSLTATLPNVNDTFYLRLYYSSTASAGAYWYQSKLELGSAASVFSDDRTSAITAQTHNPAGGTGLDGILDGNAHGRTTNGFNSENAVQNPFYLNDAIGTFPSNWVSGGNGALVVDTLPNGSSGPVLKYSSANFGGESFSNVATLTPGQTYKYSGWIKTGGVGSWTAYFGNYPSGGIQNLGAPTAWTQFSFTYAVPLTSSELNGQILITNSSATTDWIEPWGCSIVKVRSLEDEVADGSSRFAAGEAGADVTGHHQSSSTATISNFTTANLAEALGLFYAAEHGADITGNHQSATTASLSGHTLANLPDGGGRFAALISGLANADNLPAGVVYEIATIARMAGAMDAVGNLLFKMWDFSWLNGPVSYPSGGALMNVTSPASGTTHGHPVLIFANINVQSGSSGNLFNNQINRDGSLLLNLGDFYLNGNLTDSRTFMYLDDAPAAGTHTYQLQGSCTGSPVATLNKGYLFILELA